MEKKNVLLRKYLFSDERAHAYAILDGASVPDLLDMIEEHQPLHVCLIRGVDDPELAETAPYLVRLAAEDPFAGWVLGEGQGKHGGVFFMVPEEIPFIELRKHFRNMMRVRLPDGETALLRFYDPRVFNDFLPTCDQEQLREFFGPVNRYLAGNIAEKEDASELIEYSLEQGTLQRKSLNPATAAG